MRKRLILYAIIFIIAVVGIKSMDVALRYDMSVIDYVRYSAPLSAEEKAFLKSASLKYGLNPENAPFAFVDGETKQNAGIIVDYFNQLAVALETDIQPEIYDIYNLAVRVNTGDVDMAVLNRTKINNSVFDFTQTLYSERSRILVDGESPYENINDIRDISIAVISGSAAHHAANESLTEAKNIRLVLTDSLDESFNLLGMGKVDAIIGDEARISYHLNQALRSNRFKFVEGAISEEDVAIAVRRGNDVLLSILNKGVLIMKKNDQYNHINSKWFGSLVPEINESTGSAFAGNMASLAVIVFGLFFMWNKSVANKVNVRTRELKESRENLRGLIDSLNVGIMVYDAEGRILAVNRVLIDLLGLDYTDMVDHMKTEFPGLSPFEERANEQEAFFYKGRYYLVYSRKLGDNSDKDMLLIDDYTDRQKYESLNRQEAKMIAVGELTAGLAHEIRNPLGLIKSYLFLLKKKISGENESHAVDVMDDSVNRINRLIDNMLGFSRLSMEEAEYTDVRESVTSAMGLEKDALDKREIGLDLSFDLPEEKIKINEDVLKLCLVNLTKNSMDAFEETDKEGKKITIHIYLKGRMLHMDFGDNACGIPREKLDQIFDPFFTTKDNGTGLGLYILQSELRKIGGSLVVESTEGQGTAFQMELPVEE